MYVEDNSHLPLKESGKDFFGVLMLVEIIVFCFASRS